MRLVLYTEKTVAQCLSALTERLGTRNSKNLDGWVEKSGRFGLTITSPVIGKLSRRTHLRGHIERQSGQTTVTVHVSSGADRRGQIFIFTALGLIALVLLGSGALVPALLLVLAGAALYLPLAGDHRNSPLLISEVQRSLKATAKAPKKPVEPKPAPSTLKPLTLKSNAKPAAPPSTSSGSKKNGA